MGFIARNVYPRSLYEGLAPGDVRHGLSDGKWDLIELLRGVTLEAGARCRLTLAVWTVNGDHGRQMKYFLRDGLCAKITLLVDRSFPTRKPEYCEIVRETYGDDAIRVWSSHAKFAIWTGGDIDVLAMFSANLNKNPRVENYTVWADSQMAGEYLAMANDLWRRQGAERGFALPARARKDTEAVLGPPVSASDILGTDLR